MSTSLINEKFLQQLVQDVGSDLLPILIETYRPDALKHIETIQNANLNTPEGVDAVSFHGHAMKGMSASLGLSAISELGAFLETQSEKIQSDPQNTEARETFTAQCDEINAMLKPLLSKSIDALEEWLKTSSP